MGYKIILCVFYLVTFYRYECLSVEIIPKPNVVIQQSGSYAHLFPRIAATAEVGWTEKSNKGFDEFKKRLETLQMHWYKTGLTYGDE